MKDAKYLMWTWIGHQWYLFLIGLPFMFLGTITELFVPDYIGKIVDAMIVNNLEGEEGVMERLKEWMIILLIGVFCLFLNKVIFGTTAERIGFALRRQLFYSIID